MTCFLIRERNGVGRGCGWRRIKPQLFPQRECSSQQGKKGATGPGFPVRRRHLQPRDHPFSGFPGPRTPGRQRSVGHTSEDPRGPGTAGDHKGASMAALTVSSAREEKQHRRRQQSPYVCKTRCGSHLPSTSAPAHCCSGQGNLWRRQPVSRELPAGTLMTHPCAVPVLGGPCNCPVENRSSYWRMRPRRPGHAAPARTMCTGP
ncbi:uncharacterized protein [Symphalangus syndactylus]|uniref:uncharacterized protein n=1 Tax=Symphalangus syndactylus TaxID=9590 RepID=UPI0030054CEA